MNGPSDYYAKGSNPEKANKWYCLYVESKKKKKNKNELIYKTERDSQTQKTNSSLPKEKGSVWRGYKLGDWY